MKQEQILIGISIFVIIYFLMHKINSYNNLNKVSKTTTIVKTTTYNPVTSPHYVKAHYSL